MRKSKLLLFVSILTIIFLFGTSALIDRCSIFSEASVDEKEKKDVEVITEKEIEPEEEVSEETPEEEPVEEENNQDIDSEEISDEEKKETEYKEESNDEESEQQAPTIDLLIYEGPTYSEDDDVCYFRIEAVVTGTPTPTVSFSKDDSSGAWGPFKTQINLNSPTDTYTLTAAATNSEGTTTDSIELSWGCNPATKGGNSNPNINFINITGGTPLYWPDSKYDIDAIAEDPDGDNLSFEWSVTGGWIDGIYDNPTVWNTPDSGGTYVLTVSVDDGNGGTDSLTKSVFISETNYGMPIENTGTKILQASGPYSGIIFCDQGVYGTPTGETWIGDTDINEVILTYISFYGIDSLNNLENVTITDASLITGSFINWIGHPELAGDQILVQAADYGTTLEFEDQNFGGGRTLGTIDNPGIFNINFTSPELIEEIQMVLEDPVRHFVQLRLFPNGVNWNYSSDYYRINYNTMYLHIEYTYTGSQ